MSLCVVTNSFTSTDSTEAFFEVAGRLEKKTLEHKIKIKVVFQIKRRYNLPGGKQLEVDDRPFGWSFEPSSCHRDQVVVDTAVSNYESQ